MQDDIDPKTKMNLNGDIVIDSLPYCDEMLDLSQANQLVLKEMKGFKASEESVKLDLNILLRNELERAGRGEKMDVIDTDKFKMSTPELESHSAKGKKTGAAANLEHQKWLDAVNNAKSQLCYQDGRAVNLNLLQLYGSNQWRTGINSYLLI